MGKKIAVIAAVLISGFAVIFGSHIARQRTVRQVEKMLQTHVNTVAHLAKASVSQGVWSTSTIYELYEGRLLTLSHLFEVLDDANMLTQDIRTTEKVALHLSRLTLSEPQAIWRADDTIDVESIRQGLLDAPSYELLENAPFRTQGLVCMAYERNDGRGAICLDDSSFMAQKNISGIGNLLAGLCTRGVSYIALQDQTGILAIAPPDTRISKWKADRPLANTVIRNKGGVRERTIENTAHFEGLYPFQMADGSTVVMRVAIDATVFQNVKSHAAKRHLAIVVLTLVLMLLMLGIFAIIWHLQKKQTEAEQRLAAQEEERKHWSLIGELSATVAHEVRNPLNAIGMTAQRLQAEFSISDSEKEDYDWMLGVLNKESKQLNRIVTDFLELGKPIELRKKITRLSEFVPMVISSFTLRAESEQKTLETEIPDDIQVLIDTQRFTQILTNLVNNALDATAAGGRIRVTAEQTPTDIIICVTDDGTGLEKPQLSEVLKPFVSLKANGTGLGLALANRFVKLHNGTLALHGAIPNGVTAEIHLPSVRKDAS